MANKKRIKRGEPPKAAKNLDLKSPKTAEALKRQGYLSSELKYLTFEEYQAKVKDPKLTPRLGKIRYNAYEESRREKVRNVRRERQIIDHERKKSRTNVKGRNKSEKAIDNGKAIIGPAPKHIPNSISASFSLRPNKSKPLIVELQLKNEVRHLKQLQLKNKRMVEEYVQKAIKDEKEEQMRYEIILKNQEETQQQILRNEEMKNKHSNSVMLKRQQEIDNIRRLRRN